MTEHVEDRGTVYRPKLSGTRRFLLAAALLAALVAWGVGPALASASKASPFVKQFGVGGKVVSNISTNVLRRSSSSPQIFVLDDGRFFVSIRPQSQLDRLSVFRFLADGSPDLSFGDGGVVRSGFASIVVPLGDGRLLLGGEVGRGSPKGDAAVRRLNEDGSIDRSFGRDGLFRLDLGNREYTGQMVVTADGRIALQVTSSYPASSYRILALLRADGKLLTKGDPSRGYDAITAASDGTLRALQGYGDYGDDGSYLLKIDKSLEVQRIGDIGRLEIGAMLPDDGFLSYSAGAGPGVTGVVRVLPDGKIDPDFGEGGEATCGGDPYGSGPSGSALKVDRQGRVLASGSTTKCQLFRLLPDGSIDDTFSSDGVSGLPDSADYPATWVTAPDPQGRVLLARWDYERGHIVVRRLSEDGTSDPTFGESGVADWPITQESGDQARAIVSTGGGSFVTVGDSRCEGYPPEALDCQRFALVKRDSKGRLVQTFGSGGIVTHNSMSPRSVARYGNGDLVITGSGRERSASGASGFAISRFDSDGDLDRSFGDAGVTYTYLPGKLRRSTALSVAIQPDGRIVVTGSATKKQGGVAPYLPVVRYNRDGSLDQSFGEGGVVTLHLTSLERGSAISVLKNGHILIAGRDRFNPIVLRLKPDGSLDRRFGKRGVVRPKFQDRPRFGKAKVTYTPARGATSLFVLGSGRMVVGANDGYGHQDGVVFKLKADGSLARNFGRRGVRYTGGLAPEALTVDRCGGLTVSGTYRRMAHASRYFGVVRLNRQGRRDRTFHRGRTLLAFGKGRSSRAKASTLNGGRVLVTGVKERLMTNDDFATVALRTNRRCPRG